MSQLSASHVSQRSRSERSRSSSRGSRHGTHRKRDRASTYQNGKSRSNPPAQRIKSKILYSGSMMKQSLTNPDVWKKRFFVLFENRRLIYWHHEEEFQDSKRAISSIDLKHATSIHPVDVQIPMQSQPEKPKKSGWFGLGGNDTNNNNASNPAFSTSQSAGNAFAQSHKSDDFIVDRSQSDYTGMNTQNGGPHSNLHDGTPVPNQPNGQNNSLRMSFRSFMAKKQTKPNGPGSSSNNNSGSSRDMSYSATPNEEDSRSAMSYSESEQRVPRSSFRPEFPIEIVTPSRSYVLCPLDEYQRIQWLEHLRSVTFGNKIFNGWLEKLKVGARNKTVRKKWFVIYDTREIRYYETEAAQEEKGCILLDQLQIMNLLEDKVAKSQYRRKNVFELVCGGRKWVLVAESPEMRV